MLHAAGASTTGRRGRGRLEGAEGQAPDGDAIERGKHEPYFTLPSPRSFLTSQRHPPPGKGPRDLVEKFDKQLEKRYTSQLEGFSREEARERDEFKALFDFVDDMLASDEEEDVKPSTRGSSR